MKRLRKEFADIRDNPLIGCDAGPIFEDPFHWQATIIGPDNSPYSGGFFYLDIHISEHYPFKPPTFIFRTKIYHPSIDSEGLVDLPELRED